MPTLGETVDEGKVIKWLKKVGDEIKEGDILCEVETDKTAAEIPSTEMVHLQKLQHLRVRQSL